MVLPSSFACTRFVPSTCYNSNIGRGYYSREATIKYGDNLRAASDRANTVYTSTCTCMFVDSFLATEFFVV